MVPVTLIGAASFGLMWGWLAIDVGRRLRRRPHVAIVGAATMLILGVPALIAGQTAAGACVAGLVGGALAGWIWRTALRRHARLT